eukprot:269476_1
MAILPSNYESQMGMIYSGLEKGNLLPHQDWSSPKDYHHYPKRVDVSDMKMKYRMQATQIQLFRSPHEKLKWLHYSATKQSFYRKDSIQGLRIEQPTRSGSTIEGYQFIHDYHGVIVQEGGVFGTHVFRPLNTNHLVFANSNYIFVHVDLLYILNIHFTSAIATETIDANDMIQYLFSNTSKLINLYYNPQCDGDHPGRDYQYHYYNVYVQRLFLSALHYMFHSDDGRRALENHNSHPYELITVGILWNTLKRCIQTPVDKLYLLYQFVNPDKYLNEFMHYSVLFLIDKITGCDLTTINWSASNSEIEKEISYKLLINPSSDEADI